MSLKDRVRALKKNHIIAAAQAIISQNGGFLVSIEDVARTAGISKGAVLHYFPTKKLLFEAVFKDFFTRIFERGRDEMAKVSDPVDKLKSFADWLYDVNDPDAPIGYPLFFECMHRAVNDEAFRDAFREWITGWLSMLEEAIRAGISQGKIKNGNPTEMAMSISAIYQGVASRWYLDSSRHTTEWAKKTVKQAIDLIVGIGGG